MRRFSINRLIHQMMLPRAPSPPACGPFPSGLFSHRLWLLGLLLVTSSVLVGCEYTMWPTGGGGGLFPDPPPPTPPPPPLGPDPNLAPNPSFESGVGTQPNGWTPNPNSVPATFLWDVAFGRTGTSSLTISTTQGSLCCPLANPGWITTGFIEIEPGKQYQASVFTFTPDGGVGHIPAIQFFKADGTFLGTIGSTGPSGITDPNGTWVKKTFTFDLSTFPGLASATKVRLVLVQDIATTKGIPTTVFFDDVFFSLAT